MKIIENNQSGKSANPVKTVLTGLSLAAGIVTPIRTVYPIEQVLPGDQIGSADDPAGKLPRANGPPQRIFADIHAIFSRTGNSVTDFQNVGIF